MSECQPGCAPDAPEGVDLDKPSAARVYDWYLGGNHNWAVDREFGQRVVDTLPPIKQLARDNRRFLRRVLEHALDAGYRQFLDLGSGVPTAGNVHEIVHRKHPDARVVYVDYEPVAAAHAEWILNKDQASDRAAIVQADFRDLDAVLNHEETRRLIDLDRPVFLLMVAVLHFLGPEDHPAELISAYRDALPAGSGLALSHIACDDAPEWQRRQFVKAANSYHSTSNPLFIRDRDEITSWFDGWRLLDPGVVHLPEWRDDPSPRPFDNGASHLAWCGVGINDAR